jgi:hypothetical protein
MAIVNNGPMYQFPTWWNTDTEIITKLKRLLSRVAFEVVGKSDANPLNLFIRLIEDETKNSKEKGDLFELFSICYLINFMPSYQLKQLYLLSDLPEQMRIDLGLRTADRGIDIIGVDQQNRYWAIQAKFRGYRNFRPNRYRRSVMVRWSEISTFLALANSTGPYVNNLVITTAKGVSWGGNKKQLNCKTVCYGRLNGISRNWWYFIVQMQGRSLNSVNEVPTLNKSIDDKNESSIEKTNVRELRLNFLNRLSLNK